MAGDSQRALHRLAAAGRRRTLAMLLLEQGAFALSLAMAAFSLLLVLGAEVLDWYWPVAVFAVALGIGAFRLRRRVPSAYQVLQGIDRRLDLRDTLSTAWYFSDGVGARWGRGRVHDAQQEIAAAVAGRTLPRQAVPFVLSRTVYAAVAGLALLMALFALRYGARRTLDLGPPAVEALARVFQPGEEMVEAWEQSAARAAEPETPQPEDRGAERTARRLDPDAEVRLAAAQAEGDPVDDLAADAGRTPGGDEENSWADGRTAPPADGDDSRSNAGKPAAEPGKESEDQPETQPGADDNDLIRKMQDAFASLLNKLNLEAPEVRGRRVMSRESEGAEGASKESREQSAQPGEGRPQGEGRPTDDPRGQQAQKGGQTAQAGQGEAQSEEGGQPGQQSAESGAGSKDGAKQMRLAEQMEALGKLEEILGKRAENLKGDMMVEVSSGPQRLRTAYSETQATHRAAGSEVYRDEVPLELQPYVERYFTEIRRADREAEAAEKPAAP